MKVAMQMTLDGMLRALRWHAHNEAEKVTMRTGRTVAAGDPTRLAQETMRREPGRDHVRAGR